MKQFNCTARFAEKEYLDEVLRYFAPFFIHDFTPFQESSVNGGNRIFSVSPPILQVCLQAENQGSTLPLLLQISFSSSGYKVTKCSFLLYKETNNDLVTVADINHFHFLNRNYECFEALLDNVGGSVHRKNFLNLVSQQLQSES